MSKINKKIKKMHEKIYTENGTQYLHSKISRSCFKGFKVVLRELLPDVIGISVTKLTKLVKNND